MSTLTATAEPANNPPRIALALDMTSLTPDPTQATILRNDPDGMQRPVRLAEPATLTAGLWQGYDYESPFGAAVTYEATSVTPVGSVTSAAVTLTVNVPWLRHPGLPSLSVVLDISAKGNETAPVERGVFNPLGRKYPIVVSGTRRAVSSSLRLNTATLEAEAALRAILDDASVLLVTEPAGTRWGLGNFFMSVGDVDISRIGTARADEEARVFDLPYDVVDRPAGGLQAQFTYADVLANHATYALVRSRYTTYADLLANHRNGSP